MKLINLALIAGVVLLLTKKSSGVNTSSIVTKNDIVHKVVAQANGTTIQTSSVTPTPQVIQSIQKERSSSTGKINIPSALSVVDVSGLANANTFYTASANEVNLRIAQNNAAVDYRSGVNMYVDSSGNPSNVKPTWYQGM